MTVTFFALSVEDRPGSLGEVATMLSQANVNIEAFAADQAGVRILTDDPEQASQVLKANRIPYKAMEVIEIEMPNRPGELARIATALGQHGVNIVTTFGSAGPRKDNGGKIFIRVGDVDAAWDALEGMH